MSRRLSTIPPHMPGYPNPTGVAPPTSVRSWLKQGTAFPAACSTPAAPQPSWLHDSSSLLRAAIQRILRGLIELHPSPVSLPRDLCGVVMKGLDLTQNAGTCEPKRGDL